MQLISLYIDPLRTCFCVIANDDCVFCDHCTVRPTFGVCRLLQQCFQQGDLRYDVSSGPHPASPQRDLVALGSQDNLQCLGQATFYSRCFPSICNTRKVVIMTGIELCGQGDAGAFIYLTDCPSSKQCEVTEL